VDLCDGLVRRISKWMLKCPDDTGAIRTAFHFKTFPEVLPPARKR